MQWTQPVVSSSDAFWELLRRQASSWERITVWNVASVLNWRLLGGFKGGTPGKSKRKDETRNGAGKHFPDNEILALCLETASY